MKFPFHPVAIPHNKLNKYFPLIIMPTQRGLQKHPLVVSTFSFIYFPRRALYLPRSLFAFFYILPFILEVKRRVSQFSSQSQSKDDELCFKISSIHEKNSIFINKLNVLQIIVNWSNI